MTHKDRLTHDVVHAEKVKRTLLDRNEIALRFAVADYVSNTADCYRRSPVEDYTIREGFIEVASDAYLMADAFLKEREKQSKGGAS